MVGGRRVWWDWEWRYWDSDGRNIVCPPWPLLGDGHSKKSFSSQSQLILDVYMSKPWRYCRLSPDDCNEASISINHVVIVLLLKGLAFKLK